MFASHFRAFFKSDYIAFKFVARPLITLLYVVNVCCCASIAPMQKKRQTWHSINQNIEFCFRLVWVCFFLFQIWKMQQKQAKNCCFFFFMPFLVVLIQFREYLLEHLHVRAKVFTLFIQLTHISCKNDWTSFDASCSSTV